MRPSEEPSSSMRSSSTSRGSIEEMRKRQAGVRGVVEQALQQVGKPQRGSVGAALPVRSQVDAREDDLLNAGAGVSRALPRDLVDVAARRSAAGHMDDAVGAGVVATILDLDAHARGELPSDAQQAGPSIMRQGRARLEGVRLTGHGSAELRLGDARDARGHLLERLGLERGGATRDDHAGRIVCAQRLAHGFTRLLLGLAGDRAGVDDDEVGCSGFAGFGAAFEQLRRDRVGLDAVDLAAQIDDREPHLSAPSPLPNPPSS